ncbi:carboxy terminal-processing peptidase [Cesiribacter andamanensis]|nr:carboxy terminal-processing peptidase [Cesiribacter andamanensis]
MKKLFLFLFLVANLSIQCQARHSDYTPLADTTYLKPTPELEKEARLIPQALNRIHYRKVAINDSLSEVVLKSYLQALDPYKVYFLQKDVDAFQQYRHRFDNELEAGKLDAAFDIYNTFRQRFDERMAVIDSLNKVEFDFTVDEYYEADRENAPWASNKGELNEIWRQIIKSQALSYKIANKEWPDIHTSLSKRYAQMKKNIHQQKSVDVFQVYMNAFTESYDPHTSYFSPVTSENFKISMSQSLEGIGASLTTDGDYTKVAEVIAGGPAFKSKLIQKDDRIVGVAQGEKGEMVDVIGWRLDEVVQLIRGSKGSKVRLSLLRAADGVNALPVEITLVRDMVKLEEQVAKSKLVPYTKDGKTYKVGVITIPTFYMDFEQAQRGNPNYNSTTRDVRRLIKELEAQGMQGLVIDLTFNGGGSLTEAIELTGLFIPSGPVVQVRNADGSINTGDDPDPATVYGGPLAVVINRFSASASEIFAGAIQDYRRGVIIGEQTFGKGTVQNLIDLDRLVGNSGAGIAGRNGGGSSSKLGQLKITLAKFYRVTGSSTQHKGVTPDIELPSEFSAADFGESAYPAALPWDQIKSSKYKETKTVNDRLLAQLRSNYQKRLATDADLIALRENIDASKAARAETRISLNLEKRKEEIELRKKRSGNKDTLEQQINSLELEDAEAQEAMKQADPYVKESIRILAELIAA